MFVLPSARRPTAAAAALPVARRGERLCAIGLDSIGLGAMGFAVVMAFAPMSAARAESPPQAMAQTAPVTQAQIADLLVALDISGTIAVMHQEGLDYGETLRQELFPDAIGPSWLKVVGRIYDPALIEKRLQAALLKTMAEDAAVLPDVLAFYRSDLGKKVIALEIEARRSLLDPANEDIAKQQWNGLSGSDDARAGRLQRFADVNDLVESNVMGAMNTNFAFYRGMANVGGMEGQVSESQMLSDVWAQEDEVRDETENWLYPYLTLAYAPLSNADFDAYIAFSEGAAGRRMNAALFAAFDDVFKQMGYELGQACGRQMQGQDI